MLGSKQFRAQSKGLTASREVGPSELLSAAHGHGAYVSVISDATDVA